MLKSVVLTVLISFRFLGASYSCQLTPCSDSSYFSPAHKELIASLADHSRTVVNKNLPVVVFQAAAPAGGGWMKIQRITVAVKANEASTSVSDLKLKAQFLQDGQTVSIGLIDYRYIPSVSADSLMYFEYSFPRGLTVPGIFQLVAETKFNCEMLCTAMWNALLPLKSNPIKSKR